MKTILEILNHRKAILPAILVLISFPKDTTGQLSSKTESSDLKVLDKIISEIKWDNDSKYLFYHNVPPSVAEIEDYQDIEIWMVDLACWNSPESEGLSQILCVLELEYDYPVENWMLTDFNSPPEKKTETTDEKNYPVEEWMYNLQKFQKLN